MNKKNKDDRRVLSMKKIISMTAIMALMATVTIESYAQAAGFSALDDVNQEVTEKQEQSSEQNVSPVIIGSAAIVAAIQKFEALQVVQAVKSVVELKNQITATINGFDQSIRNSLGIETREAARDKELNDELINAESANAQAQIGADAALADAQNAAANVRLEAETEVEIRANYPNNALAMCMAEQRDESTNSAGAVNPVQSRGRQPSVGAGGSGGGNGPEPLRDTAGATTAEIEDNDAGEMAGKGNADLGSPGAAGPLSWYNDIAQAVLGPDTGNNNRARYITDKAWLGAGEDLGGAPENPKAGLDLRSDQFMSDSQYFMTFPCSGESAEGNFILSSFAMQFCSKKADERWEAQYDDASVKALDLASAYLIRDYMLPAPFSPFSLDFLKRVKGNDSGDGDLAARELFAKTRRLINSSNLLASTFNSQIASRTPQKLRKEKQGDEEKSPYEQFVANWELVYDEDIKPPVNPSERSRRDIEIEAYRSTRYMAGLNGVTNLPSHVATQTAIQGEMVGMQKDTLYALERIEMLLAAMLANDLEDRRDALEARVRSGASN